MFATLDPTLRRLHLPSARLALLSDTVGFIRSLPPTLIEAFRATLEEVTEAEMILHVVDITADRRSLQRQEVDRVLEELGALGKPQLLVLNKCDLLQPGASAQEVERERFRGSAADVVSVSARTGEGIGDLLKAIEQLLSRESVVRMRFKVPYDDGGALALLYEQARVLERQDEPTAVELVAELAPALAQRLVRYTDGAV